MKFVLPALPYDYDALEPYIDARTMEIHHDKHHLAYIENLIKALDTCPQFQPTSVESLLIDVTMVPEDIRTAVRNNAGGHFNHSLFWKIMKKNGGGKPNGLVASEINKLFGSFEEFQSLFNASAKSVFGSGWAWLSVHNKTGKLVVTGLPNQDSPLTYDETPILGIDVWEHAYYLKYQNKRPDYIGAWWHVINWDQVEENYLAVTKY
jgi:superoxide dismutase, Fe-Mn family